jgi:hypothetical protein
VVFPASMCAAIPMLRVYFKSLAIIGYATVC